MAAFGTLTLLIALVVATYSGVISLVGARRGNRRFIESGRAGVYALAGVLGLSSVALVYAFVTHDYSIKYVQHYSDAASPLFYQITAYWGGLDGSILWWVFLLSVFSAIAVYTNRHRHPELLPWVVVVLMAIADFFLYVIIFHKNPFDTFLTDVPTAGKGLNPLLQNAYMVTHPPSLYTGFVGMSIPFAFGLAALISGQLDDAWIVSVRKWTLGAWFFLSMGLTLGMLWAYEELGWGGFWGWDPVENAGFLPWCTATAFLHSIMIQERRGMMKIWNVTLIILTFFLTIFGTFMTRSGVVQSVHAFGQDTTLMWIFLGFMAIILVTSFAFVIKRMPELRSRGTFESWLSREAAFTVNNWILLFVAFFIMFATMFPTLSDAILGERITVGPPFFNKWMVPIGLALLFLTGIGPGIAWRKATASHLRYQFGLPVTALLVTVGICLAVGLQSSIAATICFGFCAFTFTTIAQEFWRGIAIRKKNTGSDAFSSAIGMVLRGKRRYGGYIVHVGIVLMFVGFAGTAYQKEAELHMTPGQVEKVGHYDIKFDRLAHEEDRQKEMISGEITATSGGKLVDHLRPARWFFHGHESEPTTEVAMHRAPAEDLYITLGNYDLAEGTAMIKVVINPVVDWIWFGFMMLAIGTGIALTPDSVLERMSASAKAAAAAGDVGRAPGAASVALWLGLGLAAMLAPGTAHAQAAPAPAMPEGQAEAPSPVGVDENWLVRNIVCQCGSCRHMLIECASENCGHAIQDRIEIRQLLDQKKTRDEIIQYFITKYGSQIALASPIDKGFNRLAWLLPYSLGTIAAVGMVYGAYRLTRKSHAAPSAAPTTAATPEDAEIADKLEDELRNLD
ncbi:MAG TPA: cytochrome c-type biogenesis CcmF C-terminal domain-containing protein [Polyangia bacterium]|nr:cytochrome c-type biogenesis CcmF C-terminal domain-containing protein [Polyangia bacterium]